MTMRYTDNVPAHIGRYGYCKVALHSDGTVTMWSCARQQWEHGVPSDADLAELEACDRDVVVRHVAVFAYEE